MPPLAWGTPEDPRAPLLLLLHGCSFGDAATTAGLISILDQAEQHRAQGFRIPEDRARFLVGRAALRQVLGAWLDRDPGALRFSYGPHGKPMLAGGEPAAPHFNLAHSGDLILLAFHPSRPVGVDVERQRVSFDWRPIAQRVLSAVEIASLAALAPAEQSGGFLRSWCRLEARLKASGEGLAGLRRLEAGPAEGGTPWVWDVIVPEGCRAAVALDRQA